jgi:hypothetical protein
VLPLFVVVALVAAKDALKVSPSQHQGPIERRSGSFAPAAWRRRWPSVTQGVKLADLLPSLLRFFS